MLRLGQVLRLVLGAAPCWLASLALHELGHVFHALLSGGRVVALDLHPLHFSHTQVMPNPHPLFVVWGGLIWGALLPLAAFLAARRRRARLAAPLQFVAGFCLLLNGLYLGAGWTLSAGDAGDLMALGVPRWLLMLLGLPAAGAGLWLWHQAGRAIPNPQDHRDDVWRCLRDILALLGLTLALAAGGLFIHYRFA